MIPSLTSYLATRDHKKRDGLRGGKKRGLDDVAARIICQNGDEAREKGRQTEGREERRRKKNALRIYRTWEKI